MADTPDFEPELYTLVDEEGVEQQYMLLDVQQLNDTTYYALIPYSENPEEFSEETDVMTILKKEIDNGEELLVTIEDDEEYEKVARIFLDRLVEEYGYEEVDDEGNEEPYLP